MPAQDTIRFNSYHGMARRIKSIIPDGVAAEGRPLDVLVDAAAVVGEVGEDGEGRLDRTVLHQLHLDLLHVGRNGVTLVAVGLVRSVVLGVAGLASLVAPDSLTFMLVRPIEVSISNGKKRGQRLNS